MSVNVDKSASITGGTSNQIVLDLIEGNPIPDTLQKISADFGVSDAAPVKFGATGTAQLAVSANATAALIPVWKGKNEENLNPALAGFFGGNQNADEVLLMLDLGLKAEASAKMPVKVQAITGNVSLAAGVDAGYLYARSFKKDAPAGIVARDFFTDFTVPMALDRPLREDEHLIFDFGGQATFGASVSAGWQMAGSQPLTIGKLKAAEKYAFSLVGKVGVNAKIAGRFRIDVRPSGKANVARVTVSKNDQRDLGIAADVQAGGTFTPDGFPASAREFLEAAIGTRAKNWLALFDSVQDWTDPAKVKQKLDTLAQSFVEKWTGKAIEALDKAGLDDALAELQKAIASYNSLGDRAVALFDRYYDPVADKLEARLAAALEAVTKVNSWDELETRVLDNDVFEVLDTLSGGQLAATLNAGEAAAQKQLDEIKAKAKALLDTVQNNAHAELKKVIANAKKFFGLNPLVAKLQSIGDLATIKQKADKQAIGFFERLIDKGLNEVKDSEIGKLATEVNQTIGNIKKFANQWYAKFQAALAQAFSLSVHAEYNRSANRDVMLVFDVDLSGANGQQVLRKAAAGDFEQVFNAGPQLVQVQQGTFARKLSSQRVVSINVVGWNKRPWKFDSVKDLIVESTQNLVQTTTGLVAITDTSLSAKNTRTRQNESMMSNFILRFAGQTQVNDDTFDGRDFAVDALQTAGATYTLALTDDRTTAEELGAYLQLATNLGFKVPDPVGAIKRMLPEQNGNYGKVRIDYDVRFTPEGIAAGIKQQLGERQVRSIARLIVLTNYLATPTSDVEMAWAYQDEGVYLDWKAKKEDMSWEQGAVRGYVLSGASPIPTKKKPQTVTISSSQRKIIATLYRAENALIEALDDLRELRGPMSNAELTQRLNAIGNKINQFDDRDGGDNTYFAIFDQLVAMSRVQNARNATLKISATLNDKTINTGLIA
jgi:hypothetical protein